MSKRKKKYYGYREEIPKHLKIIDIQKSVTEDFGFTTTEKRYIIIDEDTGKTFDDAQGYGYKTWQKANAALQYKSKGKSEIAKQNKLKRKIQKWCNENQEFCDSLKNAMLVYIKCGKTFKQKDFEEFIKENKIEDFSFSSKDFLKYFQ